MKHNKGEKSGFRDSSAGRIHADACLGSFYAPHPTPRPPLPPVGIDRDSGTPSTLQKNSASKNRTFWIHTPLRDESCFIPYVSESAQGRGSDMKQYRNPHEHLKAIEGRYEASAGKDPVGSEGKSGSDVEIRVPARVGLVPKQIDLADSLSVKNDECAADALAEYVEKCLMWAFQRLGYDVPNMSWEDIEDMAGECLQVRESDELIKYYHRDTLLMTIKLKFGDDRVDATVDYE